MPIPVTVVGTDVTGQLFREHTLLLGMKARDCAFQSKHQMTTDSRVLLDINYATAGHNPCRVHGRVKWLQAVPTAKGLFNVGVELEPFQGMAVVPDAREDHPMDKASPALNQPIPAALPRAGRIPPTHPPTTVQPSARPSIDPAAVDKVRTSFLAMAGKPATAPALPKSDPPPLPLNGLLSREMEDRIQAAITSHVDRIVHDAVENQITHLERFAGSERMQTCFEDIAARLAERLNNLSQQTLATAEDELNTHVAAVRQSAEEAIRQMQARINEAQASVRDASARAQTVKEQASDTMNRIKTALDQVRDAGSVVAGLDTWSTELGKRLDQVIVESTARCVREIEQQMTPQLQAADEKLRILAAGLQLAQLEQDRLAKLSTTSAANCEKEVRAFFLRLSANA